MSRTTCPDPLLDADQRVIDAIGGTAAIALRRAKAGRETNLQSVRAAVTKSESWTRFSAMANAGQIEHAWMGGSDEILSNVILRWASESGSANPLEGEK